MMPEPSKRERFKGGQEPQRAIERRRVSSSSQDFTAFALGTCPKSTLGIFLVDYSTELILAALLPAGNWEPEKLPGFSSQV